MNTILFASTGSPVKPAMATAYVRSLNSPKVRAVAAAGNHNRKDDDHALKVMAEKGLAWPSDILPADNIKLFPFDLVVCFSDKTEPVYPALPGNPAVIYWSLPDPSTKNDRPDIAVYRSLCDRICRMVEDLLQQGYLPALAQAKKNAKLVLDNLHEGIIAHDLNRNIFFFNRAAEQITGYSRKEILGRDCHEVFPDRFCKSNCSFCDTLAEPDLPDRPYPVAIRSKSGESRQIEMSVVPIKGFLGDLTGIVASFRDVTRELELASRLGEIEQFAGIIGRDPQMQELYRTIQDLANSSASVLIQGESGTGKELVAAAIHNEGVRAGKLFVPVNCGALPENLLESELFGHVKGAFTGAIRDKKGRFELADGGTVFLDEIGDISQAMQVKLLRVLQDGTFQRVGSEETAKVDVRVISATHKNLRKEIVEKRFREDLFYRLCVVPLHLPALRERKNDIPLLARHFLKRLLAEENRAEVILSPDTIDLFMTYEWPGNVRELQNVIRYLLIRCREDFVKPHHLPPNILQECARIVKVASPQKQRGLLRMDAVKKALDKTNGNRARAARQLGVSRATLYRFLDKHPLD